MPVVLEESGEGAVRVADEEEEEGKGQRVD